MRLASHCTIWIDNLVYSSSSVFWTCLSLSDSQELLIPFQPSNSQHTSGLPPLTFLQSRFWKALNESYCNIHLMLSSRLPSIDVCGLSLGDDLWTAFSVTLDRRFLMPCFIQLFLCLVSVSIGACFTSVVCIDKSLITDAWVFLIQCLCNVWILL